MRREGGEVLTQHADGMQRSLDSGDGPGGVCKAPSLNSVDERQVYLR